MKPNFLFRLFYYFRVGYGTYLSLPVGLYSFVTIVYELSLKKIPFIANLFPRFHLFILGFFFVLTPTAIFLGWFHFKRGQVFRSEQEISVESNPYAYKLQPGRETKLQSYAVLSVKLAKRLYSKLECFQEDDEAEWDSYIELLEYLEKGGDLREWKR